MAMTLTPEQQALLNGEKGEMMAKVMTGIAYRI